MASFSVEALMGILAILLALMLMHAALSNVVSDSNAMIDRERLEMRAASDSLLATMYSYALRHGYFNPELRCTIGEKTVCRDGKGNVASVKTMRRKGGGG